MPNKMLAELHKRKERKLTIDSMNGRTDTVRMKDDDRIHVLDRVSWKRRSDGQRTFGDVVQVGGGFVVVMSDNGVRFALRPRDVTKECG